MTINATSSTSGLARILAAAGTPPKGGIPVLALKRIDTSTLKPLSAVATASVRTAPSLVDPTSMLTAMRQAGVTSDNDPSKLFAEVYKDGKLVAQLYNGGSATTYGAAQGAVTGENEPYDSGPQLAQWRANKIAAAVGGTVKMAGTAQTQSQWAITSAAENAKREQAMAPYRAAMEAFRAQFDTTSGSVSATA